MYQRTCLRRLLVAAAFPLLAALMGFIAPALAAPPVAAPAHKSKEQPPETAVLSAKTVVRADVVYGSDAKQRLDVYSPRGAVDVPVVVFFHRGEWSKGDKSGVSFKPKFLNDNGIVFVSANYRLSPAVSHPAQHPRRGRRGPLGLRPRRGNRRLAEEDCRDGPFVRLPSGDAFGARPTLAGWRQT